MRRTHVTQDVSIKAFVQAMDRAGLDGNIIYEWLEQYGEPGAYNRLTLGENRLGFAYNNNHSIDYLGEICSLSGIDRSRIDDALDVASKSSEIVMKQGKAFRQMIPWDDVAAGAQAFIDKHYRREANDESGSGEIEETEEERDIAALRAAPDLDETEKKTLINARRGQGDFRAGVEVNWDNKCAVTGCSQREVLRASHVKAWRDSTNNERLNPRNGLLLSANLDALFDKGLVSFQTSGKMLVSQRVTAEARKLLGLPAKLRRKPDPEEDTFLNYHRMKVFLP